MATIITQTLKKRTTYTIYPWRAKSFAMPGNDDQ